MNKIDKVVALLDLNDEYQSVVEKAELLASASSASLDLVTIDYSTYLEDGQFFEPLQAAELRLELLEEHRLALDEIATKLREAKLDVSTFAAWGHPAHKALSKHLKHPESTIVVKSTKHHNKVARLFLSNEDWELIRHCPAPVLLVKGQDWPTSPVFLAAVDPNHANDKPAALDRKLLKGAKQLSEINDGSFHLFHSDSVPPFMGIYSLIMNEEDRTKRFAEFGHDMGVEKSDCHWTDLPIEISLPKLIEKLNASVVVMGAISRSGIDRMLIGSTAERVLDLIDCDVLVIKPD